MFEIGDIVKVPLLKYKGFRGTITDITDGMAKVEVPTYYGNGDVVVVYQDIRFLEKAK